MMETKIMKVSGREPSDIISNLPRDVIKFILTCLPLRDAVRTSILSRKWRYNWTKVPKLTLDSRLWKKTKQNISNPRVKFAVILFQLLSLHQGPITECRVSISDLKDCPEIDNLIFFLSRNGVEHLDFEFPKGEKYKLPSSVFTCSHMRHLTLKYCLINLPPAFEAFSRLLILELYKVTISDKSLENLISFCPKLEHVELEISVPLNSIEVNAPQLRSFYFGTKINSVCFKNTPLLDYVDIVMQDVNNGSVERGKCNFVEFFGSLPALKDLNLDYFIIKTLIAGIDEIPVRLPMLLLCLRQLYLCEIRISELDDIRCLFCLIRSSPYLEEIGMEAFNDKGDELPVLEFLEAEYHSDMKLNQLTKVSLKEISGTKPEMELIKLLLAKSLKLETMLIEPCIEPESPQTLVEILKQVNEFQRASPKTKVKFVDREV
ncbi:PREDICTED: F-box/FBD/LRR-repeat protein At1g13570-like [Nicotiana attenuata]|uniref:F-box/FBD/LRR-repeat protein At1g13570-like n=1 Tax=Nicotiana attenuata TaxID=49451 RepID=UPI000904647F|nr:PREDICTED: F-box/FBD/LRR-repeat protein At1g13570-like [Nicotiana attenuata]